MPTRTATAKSGTNPEELIAAAHAGCFSMALAAALQQAGHLPEATDTQADVRFEKQEDGSTRNWLIRETAR
jgi:lipoyl-dependent peroxiredoxin